MYNETTGLVYSPVMPMNIDQNLISAAAYIFEQENGVKLSDDEIRDVENSELNCVTPDEIENILKNYIEENVNKGGVLLGSAIFALGKRFNSNNKAFFISILKRLIESDIDSAYQSMIALENIGERIFFGSASLLEKERNYKLGIEYLEKNQA